MSSLPLGFGEKETKPLSVTLQPFSGQNGPKFHHPHQEQHPLPQVQVLQVSLRDRVISNARPVCRHVLGARCLEYRSVSFATP